MVFNCIFGCAALSPGSARAPRADFGALAETSSVIVILSEAKNLLLFLDSLEQRSSNAPGNSKRFFASLRMTAKEGISAGAPKPARGARALPGDNAAHPNMQLNTTLSQLANPQAQLRIRSPNLRICVLNRWIKMAGVRIQGTSRTVRRPRAWIARVNRAIRLLDLRIDEAGARFRMRANSILWRKITYMARINIPTNIDDKLALAAKVYAKHQADGASSAVGGLGSDRADHRIHAAIAFGRG